MNDFNVKVKNIVKENFKISVEKYFEFENEYNFFYKLAVALGKFINIKENEKVLDVGCGYGVSSKALMDIFKCTVKGVDLSEEMISFGKKLYPNIEFFAQDGENIDIFKGDIFDIIVYNAAIFIFPDTFKAFKNAYNMLRTGGCIGFSHYPEILGKSGENLFNTAFKKACFELPRRKVISTLNTCIENLERAGFKNIKVSDYSMELNTEFLKKFFKIPAQSASLFPKLSYKERAKKVDILFDTLKFEKGTITWKLVKGKK